MTGSDALLIEEHTGTLNPAILRCLMRFVKAMIFNALAGNVTNDSFTRRNRSSREKSFAAIIIVNRRHKFKSNNVVFP